MSTATTNTERENAAETTTSTPHEPKKTSNRASLYVGDLPETVMEQRLFDIFNNVGNVSSIRICRDSETFRSLGYAYVNYHSAMDASRAIDNLNFLKIDGREIRIMWANSDSSVRKSGVGNIFVKNLDDNIDNKILYDTFSVFGTVMSSKVAHDAEGRSLGYGFVHYENPESAQNAIEKVNNMEIASRVVEVCPFKPSGSRNTGEPKFTNVYVKNFNASLFPDEAAFLAFFQKHGEVTSVHFPVHDSVPAGFGFVNFKDPLVSKRVIEELHEKDPEKLYVAKALSKSMRRNKLHQQYLKWREEMDTNTAGRNVYVKNLPESVDDDLLREEFSKYGQVVSAKVRMDERGVSKGFGFVLYATKEDAASGIKALHGKMWVGKVLFVAFWQRKHVRKQQLEMQAQSNRKFMQAPPQFGAGMYQSAAPLIYPQQLAQGYMYGGGPSRWGGARVPQMAVGGRQQAMVGAVPRAAEQQVERAAPDESHRGDMIFARVNQVSPEHAPKITGMFLEMDNAAFQQVWNNEELFRHHLEHALKMLKENKQ